MSARIDIHLVTTESRLGDLNRCLYFIFIYSWKGVEMWCTALGVWQLGLVHAFNVLSRPFAPDPSLPSGPGTSLYVVALPCRQMHGQTHTQYRHAKDMCTHRARWVGLVSTLPCTKLCTVQHSFMNIQLETFSMKTINKKSPNLQSKKNYYKKVKLSMANPAIFIRAKNKDNYKFGLL